MSIGADSLMATVNMTKLLDKETLEAGRVIKNHNLQISMVVDAIAQTEPELFGKGTATLMAVKHTDKLDIPICGKHLNDLTPYDVDISKDEEHLNQK